MGKDPAFKETGSGKVTKTGEVGKEDNLGCNTFRVRVQGMMGGGDIGGQVVGKELQQGETPFLLSYVAFHWDWKGS